MIIMYVRWIKYFTIKNHFSPPKLQNKNAKCKFALCVITHTGANCEAYLAATNKFNQIIRMRQQVQNGRSLPYLSSGSFGRFALGKFFKSASLLRWLFRMSNLLISSLRALLSKENVTSCSMPKNSLPNRFAAIPVVDEPAKGSSIHSFSSVLARMMRVRRANGFCVGCLPHDFSQRPIAGSRHTSVICLPSLIAFMSS